MEEKDVLFFFSLFCMSGGDDGSPSAISLQDQVEEWSSSDENMTTTTTPMKMAHLSWKEKKHYNLIFDAIEIPPPPAGFWQIRHHQFQMLMIFPRCNWIHWGRREAWINRRCAKADAGRRLRCTCSSSGVSTPWGAVNLREFGPWKLVKVQ